MLVTSASGVLALVAATGRASSATIRASAEGPSPPLLIIGAGVLGRLAADEWRSGVLSGSAESCGEVIGVTRKADEARDADLRALGITPRIRSDIDAKGAEGARWPYVLFCASPGGNDDYAASVADALKLWDAESNGRFVFTSSAGVYAEDSGGVVTEGSPTGSGPRSERLLNAEKAVVEAGGTVVRLAGLYLEDRGAHNYWLTQDEVAQRPDGLINQIHYQDAAAAAVAALFRGKPGDVLLAADDAPMTREDICRAATRMRRFAGKGVPRFTGSSGGVGKIIDCSHTRDAIGWEPRFKTFDAFADSVS